MCFTIAHTAHDLGIVIDHKLSLAAHVMAVCSCGYNQLRHLQPVVQSLPVHATKMLVQAFVSCHLDYCNSLLYDISDGLFRHMQSVQNAATCLVTGACCGDHITPVLRQLHWLPVCQSVVFKIAVLVHQSLVGAAPAYLADDCRLPSDAGRRSLRSNFNDTRNCSCRIHITNLVIGVSLPPVDNCGMTSHPDYGGQDCPSTPSHNLWNSTYLVTKAPSYSVKFIVHYTNHLIYLSKHTALKQGNIYIIPLICTWLCLLSAKK